MLRCLLSILYVTGLLSILFLFVFEIKIKSHLKIGEGVYNDKLIWRGNRLYVRKLEYLLSSP